MRHAGWQSLIASFLIATAAPAGAAAPDASFATFEREVAATKAAMMRDPQNALRHAEGTLRIARALPLSPQASIAVATAEWLEAEAYIGLNDIARARPLVESALAAVLREAPNSKLHGDIMRSRGAIAAMSGRIQNALADFQRAHRIFSIAHEARSQAMALQDIGQIYWEAGDYQRVLRYYTQAAETYNDDPVLRLTNHNNRAEVLRKLGRPQEARREYLAALEEARRQRSPLLEVRILSNLAAVEVEGGNLPAAERTIGRALRLARSGEAAGWKPMVLGAAAKVAAARNDLERAAAFLDQAFAGLDLGATEMPFKEFHQLAADVFERRGDEGAALAHLKAYQRLEGDARELTASAAAQLVAARFDFANQNLKIARLKEGQLQRDIAIERQQSRFRTVVFGGSLAAGALVLMLLAIAFLSIRRSRNETRAANVELTKVNTQLEKALKAKTEFLATTSHEIRTPLNGILGMTQVLLADARVEGDIREKIEVAQGAGETMRALVDDILDVAKMESGKLTVEHAPTPLKRILADTARLWSGHASAKGLELELCADGVPEQILSDETRLRQILFNLMSNAVKFTERGGIVLRAVAEREGGSEVLRIEVQDSGIGIPEEEQPRVFEAFHQVDGGTARQFSGTGLGLAICRRLAEAMGGSIRVRSVAGAGTTFTVLLPVQRVQPGVEGPARTPDRPTRLAEARVLVLETNPMASGIVMSLLEPEVGAVACAATGEEARAAVRGGGIDHLVLEASAVAGAGEGVIEAVRGLVAEARYYGALVTLLFKPGENMPVAELVAAGASQVLMKPISGQALLEAMRGLYEDASAPERVAA